MREENQKILIIDDEANTLKVLSTFLKKEGYEVLTANSAEGAWNELGKSDVHLVVTDLKLPGKSGLDILQDIVECRPGIKVIIITAYGSINNAVQAMKLGAYNYLTKPVNLEELSVLVQKALERKNLEQENVELKKQLRQRYSLGGIVGKSKPMQDLFDLLEKVAGYESNILITGETGTGKELVARAIHYSSGYHDKPFVTIDCAAMPETLLESELFGHVRGAFTGATADKKGQIEMAEGGTLFLDEIGELPLGVQKKLLRFLQEKKFNRVGGNKQFSINARILAATNKDLEQEIRDGNWREDLHYRLNVISMHLPPLREHKEDISLLADFFLERYNAKHNKSIEGVANEVVEIFLAYDWPGNVRELENVIERAVVLCTGEYITTACIPPRLTDLKEENHTSNNLNLLEVEKNVLCKALDQTEWNQSAAARILGISRKQLRTKMNHHGLLSNR